MRFVDALRAGAPAEVTSNCLRVAIRMRDCNDDSGVDVCTDQPARAGTTADINPDNPVRPSRAPSALPMLLPSLAEPTSQATPMARCQRRAHIR